MVEKNTRFDWLTSIFRKLKRRQQTVSIREIKQVEEDRASSTKYVHRLISPYPGYVVIERYPVYEPFAYINIVEDPGGQIYYEVQEASLTPDEERLFSEIRDHLVWEIKPITSLEMDVVEEIRKTARRIIREFQIRFTKTPSLSWSKIMYYIERDILGFGKLDPVFKDRHIEDISCNGYKRPIYVWHRKYESIPTNVEFENETELDDYIIKLAHMSGKHISVAYPILDAILPGGHRLAATFRREVSTSGSTFTVRKFSESPITIVDMISYGTISPDLAAYLWLAMDYKMTMAVLGVTGAGKTSTLNASATLLRPTYKIVTIEDTPELRLPHSNWVQLVSRPSYIGSTVGEVSLFHLVKLSLRYRPDVIIVGEVRGEEAYVLFQAMATGHSGMTTLHAENVDAAVKRLTSPPMNIPPSYIPLLNMALVIKRVQLRDEKGRLRAARRVTNVWEIRDYEDYVEVARWDPVRDEFHLDLGRSVIMEKIAGTTGVDIVVLRDELEKRKKVLKTLAMRNLGEYRWVARVIHRYYMNPSAVLKEMSM